VIPPHDNVEAAYIAMSNGDIAEAMRIYRMMLRRAPNDRALHYSLGQLLLLVGDFEAGLEEWEWRTQAQMPLPRWRGAPLKGARIFVRGEQGFGDNFQFVRYAPMIAARGGTVVVGTRGGLRPLLSTVPGVSQVIESGEAIENIACQIPMMSLPYIFGTRLNTIPAQVPYIAADGDRVAAWQARFAARPGLRVGLVWSGNPDATYNARRSPGLAAVRPLMDCPGVTIYGLQMGAGRTDLQGAALPDSFTDLGPDLKSFSDTAAAMMALDLVISSCTSPAHLAGALGRPVWIMLAMDSDWRWLRDREDSPWYPTARLFRQAKAGAWDLPVARMRGELERLAAAKAG
jgi:hypothetical protein